MSNMVFFASARSKHDRLLEAKRGEALSNQACAAAGELMSASASGGNAAMAAMKHCHKQRGSGCKKYN